MASCSKRTLQSKLVGGKTSIVNGTEEQTCNVSIRNQEKGGKQPTEQADVGDLGKAVVLLISALILDSPV